MTFDRLHIPADLRTLFMDTVRSGGVVLAVDDGSIADSLVEHVSGKHEALRVETTSLAEHNPSHNVAQ